MQDRLIVQYQATHIPNHRMMMGSHGCPHRFTNYELQMKLDCEPGTKNPVRIFFRSDLERTAIFFPSSFHLLD